MSRHLDKITTTQPFSPRDFLSTVRDILGDSFVLNLFRVDIRAYQRWTAKKHHVAAESYRENYIEKHDVILGRLMKDGYEDIARAIVAHHAEIVDCVLTPIKTITPDKNNIKDEMLDDYPCITDLHEAIRKNMDIDEIRYRVEAAKREIDETVELYRSNL